MKAIPIPKALLWDYTTPPDDLLWRLQRIADFFHFMEQTGIQSPPSMSIRISYRWIGRRSFSLRNIIRSGNPRMDEITENVILTREQKELLLSFAQSPLS